MKRVLTLAILSALLVSSGLKGQGAGKTASIVTTELIGDKDGFKGGPVTVSVLIPLDAVEKLPPAVAVHWGDKTIVGQLTLPGINTESLAPEPGKARRELHVIGAELKPGERVKLSVDLNEAAPKAGHFEWIEKPKQYAEAVFVDEEGNKKPMMRYMCRPYDNSSKAARDRSYKVFHHLYDPDGKAFVTNGGEADDDAAGKKFLYPHHRGLMFGYQKVTYDGNKTTNLWECPEKNGGHYTHEKYLSSEEGPVLARHRVLIYWWANDKEVIAHEEREMTIYNTPGATLVDFATKTMAADKKVSLKGDPQHAGFQFRARQEVADTKQVYYIRPDGKGAINNARNWDPATKQGPVDLPWDAMNFPIGKQRYTVGYFNSPTNPKDSRFSEREYGRFGCYFEWELTQDHPLTCTYRVSLQKGEADGAAMQTLFDAYAMPPRVFQFKSTAESRKRTL